MIVEGQSGAFSRQFTARRVRYLFTAIATTVGWRAPAQTYRHVRVECGVSRQTADEHGTHQIGEVAEVVGLSLRTIRHYEEVGLVLPSGRSTGGFRLYTDEDIERLRLVKHMKPLDFTLGEMRDLLGVRDRLAEELEEDERAGLMDELSRYAAAAESRCQRLRGELAAAEAMASMLRCDTARRRPPSRSRR